jgi:acyl-CoA reductase-like NAD-dependent aldehyde dehydrogenase
MRSAVLQLPDTRTANERRQVLRAAIRQLERAEIYLAAVAYMELDDREAQRAVGKLRTDVESLRRYLAVQRSGIRE